MIDKEDIEQILYQLGVGFNIERDTNEFASFLVEEFGLKVVWSLPYFYEQEDDWNVIVVKPTQMLNEVRENIIWGLAEGGFFHYLRMNFPNTFYKMLAGREGEDWHKKIINRRLAKYGDRPEYNYHKQLNKDALPESSTMLLSMDPGFYDII